MSGLSRRPLETRPCRLPASHPLTPAAGAVCQVLVDAGFRALLAGGCVRDHLLQRDFDEIDIATSAHPDDVLRLFPGSIAIGKAFGVIQVTRDGHRFEVATFRIDSDTGDGRRPDSVTFSDEQTDAHRRDFTINSLYLDPAKQLVLDYTGGLLDLERNVVRTVGPPMDRFREDYLRILRGLRFSHTLGFTLDPETRTAIEQAADHIRHLSIERIHQELDLLFTRARQPGTALKDLVDTGVWTAVLNTSFPTASALPCPPMDTLYDLLNQCRPVTYWQALALYLHHLNLPLASPLTAPILQTFGFSRRNAEACADLANHFQPIEDLEALDNHALCQLANLRIFPVLIHFLKHMNIAEDRITALESRAAHFQPPPTPWIQGHALIEAGIPEGPLRGALAREAYHKQVNGEFENRSGALNWLRSQADASNDTT